jgi:glycosyltransferase involved in cell wall biosynthesis
MTSPTPLVSILIPVYNREQLIERTVLSALAQTYTATEIIIVDNASTDGTWNKLMELKERHPGLKIFRNETNIGPLRNWLRAAELAQGAYGKFVFSDDLIAPEFLQKTVPFLENHPNAGFVYGPVVFESEPGVRVFDIYITPPPGAPLGTMDWFVTESLKVRIDNNELPVNPSCALFRLADLASGLREGLELDRNNEFRIIELSAGPDLWIYLYASRKYSHFGYLPEAVSHFLAAKDAMSLAFGRQPVFEGYTRARLHFAERYLGPKTTRLIAARLWLTACNREKHLYSPFAYCKMYCDVEQRVFPILQAIAEWLQKRLKRSLSAS